LSLENQIDKMTLYGTKVMINVFFLKLNGILH
jgi:hypothetical protein